MASTTAAALSLSASTDNADSTTSMDSLPSILAIGIPIAAIEDSRNNNSKNAELKPAPLSPKLPTRAEERRVMRALRHIVPMPAPSKALAISAQQSLAGLRVQYRQQAAQNYSTYSENINRLINTLLFEILLLGGPAAHANNKTFATICALCIRQAYRESVETRRSTWQYIENNIDALISGAEEAALQDSSDADDSDDIDDSDHHVSAYTEQFSFDIYESCVFKMRQVRQLIRERDAQKLRAEQIETNICLNMFQKFQVNCQLTHACRPVGTSTGLAIPTDSNHESCEVCAYRFDSDKRLPVLMTCCSLKTVICTQCLVYSAFAGSEMGCAPHFKCVFCKSEISIYDHLDAPPPAQNFAMSIGDAVKRNSRRRNAPAQCGAPPPSQQSPPSPPRSRRQPINKRKKPEE